MGERVPATVAVMRFGLVGTGFWARDTHGAALAAAPEVEFVGAWGRDPGKASALAQHHGVRAFDDLDAMLAEVEALSFAVPPHVQAPLAERAARAGKHLLLEKPVALTGEEAASLADAVREAGVATVVFFTRRFTHEGREWFASLEGSEWEVGQAHWFGDNFEPGSPFDTPWRREKGGLWDVGPHAVALLTAALGRVTRVHAVGGVRDVVHLVLEHDGGATSTVTLTLSATSEAAGVSFEVIGPAGRLAMPTKDSPSSLAAQVALGELVAAAADAAPGHPPQHSCDVEFGRYVTDVLAEAERQVTARTT